jgi:Na+/H+ antiporter NhaD/arsenite permease-like protein
MSDLAERRLFAPAKVSAPLALVLLLAPGMTWAGTAPDLTASGLGYFSVAVFVLAYVLVVTEDITGLRKSKPLVLAAGLIWLIVSIAWQRSGVAGVADLLRHNLLEYAELLLFLLAAMSYVNTLEERRVFEALRARLIARQVSFRSAFWLTGLMAFCLSPFIDNLTTALVVGAIVVAMGRGKMAFIAPACTNIVVAANAGGAFSPFGDITTLMVWQKGVLGFFEFFRLFAPCLINWLVPAVCMSIAIPKGSPTQESGTVEIKRGGIIVMLLFALTVLITVCAQQFAGLPPFLGMMSGLGILQLAGYFIRRREARELRDGEKPFDVFMSIRNIEWDTLLFFYGVILCVGGLAALGYLNAFSSVSYQALGPSAANVLLGLLSAVIDNIPIMFAVLTLEPGMSHGHWLLVTLTAGVGGSLLSIGSAAGVALMGQARGSYTFLSHFKWTWAVALGYAASIAVHFAINAAYF